MFAFIWSLIVGGVLGAVAGSLSERNVPGGIIGNIITGFVGSSLGTWLIGSFGPSLGGFYIVPSLIGAIILLVIVSMVFGRD